MLINDAAEIVYDQSLAAVPLGDLRSFENVPLGQLFGNVMLSLLDAQVFTRFGFVNRQGKCQKSNYAPSVSPSFCVMYFHKYMGILPCQDSTSHDVASTAIWILSVT